MGLYEISQYRNICTSKFYEISYETLRNIITKLYEIPYETLRNTIRNFTKYHNIEIFARQNFTNYHMKLYEISHRKFAKYLHVKILRNII